MTTLSISSKNKSEVINNDDQLLNDLYEKKKRCKTPVDELSPQKKIKILERVLGGVLSYASFDAGEAPTEDDELRLRQAILEDEYLKISKEKHII